MSEIHYHVPVLVDQVLHHLPTLCHDIIDGTLGHGGHTLHMIHHLHHLHQHVHIYGFDRDQDMISKAEQQLQSCINQVTILHDTYQEIHKYIADHIIPSPDVILLDLGVNSDHFTEEYRGFSLQYDGPLDMRFDRRQNLTASHIINTYSATQLSDILIKYGEFTMYHIQACVDMIVHKRVIHTIDTTAQLRDICLASHIPFHKISAFFQALRIEVNQEMKHLEDFLHHMGAYLKPGARVMIMTYHSIEDRIVKYAFLDYVKQNKAVLVNKKVIKPTYQEQKLNKKSRSAKLRIIEMI